MPKRFRDYLPAKGPPWMGTGTGSAWARGIGDVMDALLLRAKASVKLRFPSSSSPADALTAIGAERQLPKIAGESNASYAERLRVAWSTWIWVGTPKGVLRALHYAGYTGAYLITQKGRSYTLDGNLEPVETIGAGERTYSPNFWNSFSVWLPNLHPDWGGVVPADGSSHANRVKALVRLWKPAHARLVSIKIGNAIWWGKPGVKWGTATKWGAGTTTGTWLP